MELITKYFPGCEPKKLCQYGSLDALYKFWNDKINVVSRKDIHSLYERHVLHSLGIAKVITFNPNARVLDIGTGGGFPGIPLAIMFPQTEFVLVDSIGKKIKVVKDVTKALELNNVSAYHQRAESVQGSFDFVITRAVTKMQVLIQWTQNKFNQTHEHSLNNGIIALKGGDLTEELRHYPDAKIHRLSDYFDESFFQTKQLIHLPSSQQKGYEV